MLTEDEKNVLKKMYGKRVITVDAVFEDENDIINTYKGTRISDEFGFSKLVTDSRELILLTAGLEDAGCILKHTENMKKFELAAKRALAEANPEKYGAFFDDEGNVTDYVAPLDKEEVDDIVEYGKEHYC